MKRMLVIFGLIIVIGLCIFSLFHFCSQKKEPLIVAEESLPAPILSDPTVSDIDEVVDEIRIDTEPPIERPKRSVVPPSKATSSTKKDNTLPPAIVIPNEPISPDEISKSDDIQEIDVDDVEIVVESTIVTDDEESSNKYDDESQPENKSDSISSSKSISLKPLSHKIFAGSGLNWFSGTDPSAKNVIGLNVGASYEMRFTDSKLICEPGIRFITKGTELQTTQYVEMVGIDSFPLTCDSELSLSYLDVFTKAKLDFPISSGVSLQPFTGFAVGLLLDAKEENTSVGYSDIYDATAIFSKINLSFLLGVDIPLTRIYTIGIEYDVGIPPILTDRKEKVKYSAENKNVRTNSIMINMGLMF